MRFSNSTFTRTAFVGAWALAAAMVPMHASAASTEIAGLVNTGDSSSLALDIATGAFQDTAYDFSVLSGTAVAPSNGLSYVATSHPGVWLPNDSTSSWLTPDADGWASFDPSSDGQYKWSLSFDMTGMSLDSASFAGRMAADNQVSVLLNGVEIANSSANPASFSSWTTFGADTGFVQGINTLDFIVLNTAQDAGNPTGLRVEFTQSYATAAAVPEPQTVTLMGIGIVAVLRLAARQRRQG